MGVSKTIKAQYAKHKESGIRNDGFAETLVMEKDIMLVNGTKDDVPRAIRATYGKTKTEAALCDNGYKPTYVMEKEPKMIQNPHGFQKGGVKDVCPTVTSSDFQENNFLYETKGWRIRKLTPRECFRLMGVDDADIDKLIRPTEMIGVMVNKPPKRTGVPKTQQYKLAGNSIVVDVLYHIFRKMFIEQGNESKQLELF